MKQSSILMTFLKIFYFSVILCSTFKCIVCFFNYKNGIFKSKFLKGGQYLNRVSGSISTPFNDFKYSPKLSKSIEDNINHIVLIESLNSETFDQAKTNKLLYEWLIVNFKVLFPLIHKYEAGFDDVLILLQNTKPSVVSATILSSSPVNVSATVKVLVKPYMIIPSLLERKESMLKEILSYVINVSDVNQNMIKMLGAFHNMAVDTTSGLVALKSILSLDDPENSQNNVIQTQINNPYSIDDSDFLLPAFNEFMCKYVIDQLLSTFDSMFPSAPTELDAAAGGESEYDRALLKQFQVWAQSTDFALRRTNTKQKMYYLSPLTLFYTFLEENNHFKGTFDDNDKTHTNKLVSVSYIYSLIVSSISKKIVQVLSMSMLQKHYSYVKYYNEVLTTLELSSVTGPSFTVHNSELIDPSHQHTFVKRLGDAMHYPSLEVRLQGMALTDAEKDSFLLTYVTKILNTTAFKTNNNNDDDDGSSEGVSAGNPNTDRDGAAAGGSGEVNRVSDFLSSSGDIKVMFPFPLDRGSDPTQTKTSAAGWRKPPGVKILDPPRNRPPPPPPAEKDTYIDVRASYRYLLAASSVYLNHVCVHNDCVVCRTLSRLSRLTLARSKWCSVSMRCTRNWATTLISA